MNDHQEKTAHCDKENSKTNRGHHGFMLVGCILLFVVFLVARSWFGVNQRYLFWGLLVVCLLSHVLMMKRHQERGKHEKGSCH